MASGNELSLYKAQLSMARETLKTAWNDVYFDSFRWAIIKAWHAGREALEVLMEAGGLKGGREWPLSLMAFNVEDYCKGLTGQANSLDYLNAMASDKDLYLIVYYGTRGPSKAEALRAVESSLAILETAEKCIVAAKSGRAYNRAPRAYTLALDYARVKGESTTVIRAGKRLYIVSTSFEGLTPLERIEAEGDLPPGFTPLLLSASEAYSLFSLPWTRIDDVEVLSDPLGLERLVK